MNKTANGEASVVAQTAAPVSPDNLCHQIPPTETPKHEACVDSALNKAQQYRRRAAFMAMELDRHDLTFRELQLALLINRMTLGWERDQLVIEPLDFFVRLTGVGKPDVIKILRKLHARRIIRIQKKSGRATYWMNEDVSTWGALAMRSTQEIERTLNELRLHNGLEPMDIIEEATSNFFRVRADAKNFGAEVGKFTTGIPLPRLSHSL